MYYAHTYTIIFHQDCYYVIPSLSNFVPRRPGRAITAQCSCPSPVLIIGRGLEIWSRRFNGGLMGVNGI